MGFILIVLACISWIIIWGFASFLVGASGGVITLFTTGKLLIENGNEVGNKLTDGGGPILYASIIAFIIIGLLGRLSYQANTASAIYFFSGVAIFVLGFVHPKDVKLAFIIVAILSVGFGVLWALVLARVIYANKMHSIGYYNITKRAPLVGTIVGFIPVAFIMFGTALNLFLNYAEMAKVIDISVGDTYVVSDFSKNCYIWALIIGVIFAAISVGIGIILEKNKDEVADYYV